MAQQRLKAARVISIHTNHTHCITNHRMKFILVHRYRSLAVAVIAPLLSSLATTLSHAHESLAAPGAAAAALRVPVTAVPATSLGANTLGDDGKDMKEVKVVKPPEASPLFNMLINVEFADKYVTPRGMIVRDRGLTIEPLALIFLNAYKGEGFINSFTIVGGGWWDFGTSTVSKHPPYGAGPKTNFTEFDPIGGIAVGFAKHFKLEVTYTAFVERILDIGTSHHLETKLSFDDSEYLKAFALHPYFSYWQELANKATDADVPYKVFGPSPNSGKHPQPYSSYYFDIGIMPGYTFQQLGGLRLEALCRILLSSDRFYGEYYKSSPTIGVGLFELGMKATLPLNFMPKNAGHWSVHAGFRYMNFVDDNLYNLNTFNDPGQPVRTTWQAYGGISVFF